MSLATLQAAIDLAMQPNFGDAGQSVEQLSDKFGIAIDDFVTDEIAAPSPHHLTHETGGTDEIDLVGLSGLLADDQHVIDSEVRAAINDIFGADGKADTDIDLDSHKLINVVDPIDLQDAATKKYVDDSAAIPALHAPTHAVAGTDPVTITHAQTTGRGTDDHHAQSHTVASHNDTSATGAQLDTLTDDSMADALHRHSELSASDGSPNPVLSVDADGNVGINNNTPLSRLDIKGVATANIVIGDLGGNTAYAALGLAGSISATDYNFTSSVGNASLYINRPSGKKIQIRENNVDQVIINDGGDVGIGDTPNEKLDVDGNVNLNNTFTSAAGELNRGYYVYKNGLDAYGLKLQWDGSKAGTMMFGSANANKFLSFGKVGAALEDDDMVEYMRIDLNNGNVGINVTDPDEKLEVDGNIKSSGSLTTGGGRICSTKKLVAGDSPYTVLSTDHKIYCNTAAGAITLLLPVGVDGTEYIAVNTGSSSNSVIISPNGAELFNGVNVSYTLADGTKAIIGYEETLGWW